MYSKNYKISILDAIKLKCIKTPKKVQILSY